MKATIGFTMLFFMGIELNLLSYIRDFVYGGRIGRCAVEFDNLFGQGFFRELMTVSDEGIEEMIERVQKS